MKMESKFFTVRKGVTDVERRKVRMNSGVGLELNMNWYFFFFQIHRETDMCVYIHIF